MSHEGEVAGNNKSSTRIYAEECVVKERRRSRGKQQEFYTNIRRGMCCLRKIQVVIFVKGQECEVAGNISLKYYEENNS